MHKVGNTPNPMELCIMRWDFRGEMKCGDDTNPMHYEIYALLVYALWDIQLHGPVKRGW